MKRNAKCQLEDGENKDIVLSPITVHKLFMPILGPWLTTSAPESGSLLASIGFCLHFQYFEVMPGLGHADKLRRASSQLVVNE